MDEENISKSPDATALAGESNSEAVGAEAQAVDAQASDDTNASSESSTLETSSVSVAAEMQKALDDSSDINAESPAVTTGADVKKKKSKLPLVLILVLLVLAAGGAAAYFVINGLPKDKQANSGQAKDDSDTISSLHMTGNSLSDFDLKFLKLNNTEENKVYSPLSIKYALKMLSDGADGETKTQIDNILGDYQAKSYLNSKNRSLANAMFIADDYKGKVLDSYIDGLKTNYNADVIYDSFASANTINKWIENNTLGIIKNMLQDTDVADLDFALVNALAIDMYWTNRIECASSDDMEISDKYYNIAYQHEEYFSGVPCLSLVEPYLELDFDGKKAKAAEIGASINNYDIISELGEDNIRSTVQNAYNEWLKTDEAKLLGDEATGFDMDKYIKELGENYGQVDDSTDFKFYDDDSVKAFAKDLKEYDGSTLQYVGIMPKEQGLADYINNASADSISSIVGSLKEIKKENFKEGVITQIDGYIPFFNYSYDMDLMNNLKDLGVTDVFDGTKANLSKMISDEVKGASVTDVKHKADIDFSNDGIKAAAVTVAGGLGDNAPGFEYKFDVPVETIDLSFDKPYMYIIRDKSSGEVWFAGTVYEPNLVD